MTANTTVSRPDLPQLKRRARELQRALLSGDADAIDRLKRAHPLWRMKLRATAGLADAQLVIAREAGHASWPALRRQVLSVRRVLLPATTSPTIPVHASSELRGPLAPAFS